MKENVEQTARGFEQPVHCQFSIFLANRLGQLKELLDVFLDREIRVLGFSVVDSTDWAVVRVVVSDPDKAREVLKRERLPFTESEVLLVELAGENDVSLVCGLLLQAEVAIHFAYPLTVRRDDHPLMAFHVDDHLLAAKILVHHGLGLIGYDDLDDPGL